MKFILEKAIEFVKELFVAILLFAATLAAFEFMQSKQEAEILKALQTVERIKLKWAMIKE